MAVSETSIANRAVTKLGANRILSLTEDTPEARALNAVYETTRNAELRAHPWAFATERAQLSALSSTPSWGYSKEYQLPADCIRVLSVGEKWIPYDAIGVSYREYPIGTTDESFYQIEGQKILTDLAAPLKIRYTKKETDPAKFDDLFIDALACRLAYETAADIIDATTGDFQRIEVMYNRAIMEAKRVNAITKPPRKRGPSAFTLARR